MLRQRKHRIRQRLNPSTSTFIGNGRCRTSTLNLKGLDEQESPGELKKPKVSFNVNAKAEGANKEPALFEDTISNAAIPGAPSFNVQKHEYASYFKHIRDRVSLYWFLGYGTRAEIKLETKDDKPIIIEFKVLPNGSIDDVKIADDAGNFQLASRLVSSIKKAAPLNPFGQYQGTIN